MTTIYIAGPADDGAKANRLAGHAKVLGAEPDRIILTPMATSLPAERIRAVCDADIVVVAPGWEFDVDARHDVQAAVWCAKELWSTLQTPVTVESVQTILDRGLQLPAVADVDGGLAL